MHLIPGTDLRVPDTDTHFTGMGKAAATYQHDRLRAAYSRVHRWGCAVDAGAHVGILTRAMAERFEHVFAFEPNPENFACLLANTRHLSNVTCVNKALGEQAGRCRVQRHRANSGDTQLEFDGEADTDIITLTDYYNENPDRMERLGLVKLDVQGYEAPVLRGAGTPLMAWRPVCILEQEGDGKLRTAYGERYTAAARELEKLGAIYITNVGVDRIYMFPKMHQALVYDKYDKRGDYHWQKYEEKGGFYNLVNQVLALTLAAQPRPRSILDVGCGDGLYAYLLKEQGIDVLGIDTSLAGILVAEQKNVPCRQMSIYDIAQLGRCFDMATLHDVLEHLPDQERAVQLLGQLTPRLCILNPHPKGSRYHTREFTMDELTAFMAEQGWKLVRSAPVRKSLRDRRMFAEFVKEDMADAVFATCTQPGLPEAPGLGEGLSPAQ